MKRATTGSGSSLSTGVSLSTFPWKVWERQASELHPTLGQRTGAVPRDQTPTISS